MDIQICKHYGELSAKAAELVGEQIKQKTDSVLGLATGGTPEGMYAALVDQYKNKQLSFREIKTFNLDEYIGLPADHPLSYRVYMDEHLFNNVDISEKNVHLPDGNATDLAAECDRYEERLRHAGGIDLQVLGLGHNGHIGFNEPGTAFESSTHIVDLDEKTREANARYFEKKSAVPRQAITMGIQTILSARKVLVLVSGTDKAEAVRDMIYREMTTSFPATVLQKHPAVTVIADEEAATHLQQEEQTPN
ncbi:glucosamine-6-phosphate deaminase [Natribacillus halophilus]|uniref:Glucosamine-6-phosphate deaminase n=1 Tax=Natribacillus halophilus TaxID=549003 RepID=A0A1G8S375_9BACI|nr:glucosamine-6-phosphate deaminase [Natribacillus halophilus]SDJ23679.1 glucosamine-6-phosphate deaminase [Natribacillus halophilus]